MNAGKKLLIFPLLFTLMSLDLPKGWRASGNQVDKYEMGVVKGEGYDGKNCVTIRSLKPKIDGFGSLMQYILPGKYAGKKVKLTAWIKSKDVKGGAGLWMRVDREMNGRYSAFDDMGKRAIKGTTDWKKYEVVLEVSEYSAGIAYGVLLAGTGQIWFDNVEIEVIENKPLSGKVSPEPINLNFED